MAIVVYLDASLPVAVYHALVEQVPNVLYPGQPGCPITRLDTPDTEWLSTAGRLRWVVIVRDKLIRQRPEERRRLLEHGVRAFALTGAGNYTAAQLTALLLRSWKRIEQLADEETDASWYSITQGGIRKLALD
jgi:PIN domain-containing protein